MTAAGSTWVVFDYGGVICTPQPDEDVAALAAAVGVPVPDFQGPYWAYRLSYDRAELDGTTYWHKVAAALGLSFAAAQVAELVLRALPGEGRHTDFVQGRPDWASLAGEPRRLGQPA